MRARQGGGGDGKNRGCRNDLGDKFDGVYFEWEAWSNKQEYGVSELCNTHCFI